MAATVDCIRKSLLDILWADMTCCVQHTFSRYSAIVKVNIIMPLQVLCLKINCTLRFASKISLFCQTLPTLTNCYCFHVKKWKQKVSISLLCSGQKYCFGSAKTQIPKGTGESTTTKNKLRRLWDFSYLSPNQRELNALGLLQAFEESTDWDLLS